MAKAAGDKRRPRVRKNAPTVRQRVEAATAEKESGRQTTKGPVRRAVKTVGRPITKLRLRDNRALKVITIPLRFLKKVLGWLVPKYFVNSWREIRLVQWPSRRETWRLTLAVFIFAAVFGALVAGVDKGLDEVFKKVVLK